MSLSKPWLLWGLKKLRLEELIQFRMPDSGIINLDQGSASHNTIEFDRRIKYQNGLKIP
jgi:hypothetical protein